MIKVSILERRGPSLIVEWGRDGRPYRAVVPTEAERDGYISDEVAENGIEYGLDYERLITVTVTPERLAAELRRRGYWTVADLERDWQHVLRVFALMAYKDAAAMLEVARRTR